MLNQGTVVRILGSNCFEQNRIRHSGKEFVEFEEEKNKNRT